MLLVFKSCFPFFAKKGNPCPVILLVFRQTKKRAFHNAQVKIYTPGIRYSCNCFPG